jgi:O-antigen/teichoic acid export membrane protein
LLDLGRRFLAESLFKNSAFLVLNLGVGAVSGYGGLALLTHFFSVQDVGLSATAVSAAALIETISLLGITYSVPRYLPTAKNRTAMINTLLTAVILITALACLTFLALPYARKLFVLGGWLFGLIFLVATCVQAGTTMLSTVLVADRSSDKVVRVGMIPAAVRLVAPPALSFLGGLGSFVARVVPDSFGFVMFGAVLVRSGHRFRPTLDIGVAREMARFSIGMYVANIIGGLPLMLLPLFVLSRVGAQQSAYWSIAMSISAILYSLPSMVTSALLPEVSLRPAERPQLLRRAALLIVSVVTPALVIAFFGAPIALAVFGHGYTSGTLPVLRWLIGAGFITMLNAVSGAVLFIAKKSKLITIVNAVDAVIVIGLVIFWATSATDIAIAWAVGDVANTVLFGAFAFLAVREVGGRLEKLGEDQVSDTAATPQRLLANPTQRTLDLLFTLAEQQRAVDMYKPYPPSLTTSMGLYSVAALREAERRRLVNNATSPPSRRVPDGTADTHEQALDLLFSMAARQRAAQRMKPGRYPPDGSGAPPDRHQ